MVNKVGSSTTPWLMIVFNYYSVIYLVAGGALVYWVEGILVTTAVIVGWLYLLPPLVCRLWITLSGKPEGEMDEHQSGFMQWWGLSQIQAIYSRLPFLEEILRLVPGLYNLWLGLWGGRVHMTVFWSPGVHVFDRYHLMIGKGVIVGGSSRVGAHVINRDAEGHFRLCVAPLTIKQGVTIGMNACVGPGVLVHENATVPVGKVLMPFQVWPNSTGKTSKQAKKPENRP